MRVAVYVCVSNGLTPPCCCIHSHTYKPCVWAVAGSSNLCVYLYTQRGRERKTSEFAACKNVTQCTAQAIDGIKTCVLHSAIHSIFTHMVHGSVPLSVQPCVGVLVFFLMFATCLCHRNNFWFYFALFAFTLYTRCYVFAAIFFRTVVARAFSLFQYIFFSLSLLFTFTSPHAIMLLVVFFLIAGNLVYVFVKARLSSVLMWTFYARMEKREYFGSRSCCCYFYSEFRIFVFIAHNSRRTKEFSHAISFRRAYVVLRKIWSCLILYLYFVVRDSDNSLHLYNIVAVRIRIMLHDSYRIPILVAHEHTKRWFGPKIKD